MEDLIYTLKEYKDDFKKGIYTVNEYHNTVYQLKQLLNKNL